jgi:hypothetical protein
VPFAFLIKPQGDVMLNGQTFSSRTGKTSGLPKLKLIVLAGVLMIVSGFFFTDFAEAGRVRGYYRNDGTYVHPYQRTNPDSNPYNNYSFPGNYNPNTGGITPGNPNSYLNDYYNPSPQRSPQFPQFYKSK